MSANDDALLAQIAERRNDEAFMARLRERMAEDAPLMERIKVGECETARLVESRDGGTTLVYECECGARLVRTRSEAEAAKRSQP
jgi:hypothetical protein